MVKMTLQVEGMACSMCESPVNDAVRRAFPVKKVSSSHGKNLTEIVAEQPLDEAELRRVIESNGYRVTDIKCAPCEKKRGFPFFGR